MKKHLVFLLLLFVFTSISGQNSLSDTIAIQERVQYIQLSLTGSAKNVNLWWYGWLGAYSAATIGQGIVGMTGNDLRTRQDMLLGAGTTLLGAAFQLTTPIHTGKDAKQLRLMPDFTPEEKMAKLAEAERLLELNAKKEKAGRSWKIHALNTAVNLGSGIITWKGFHRSFKEGMENFLLNTLITEAQIWTQPTRTLKEFNRYKMEYSRNQFSRLLFQPDYSFRIYPGGASLVVRF